MGKQSKIDNAKHIAQPMLEDGEQIEIVTVAMFGRFSTAKSMRFGFLIAILTLGLFYGLSAPKKRYLVVTDRRLIFFEMSASGQPTDQVAVQVARSALRTEASRTRRAVLFIPTLEVDFIEAGAQEKVRLTFPAPARKDGNQLAAMLTSTGSRPSP